MVERHGDEDADELSARVRRDPPWRVARDREGLGALDRGSAEIRLTDLAAYHRTASAAGGAVARTALPGMELAGAIRTPHTASLADLERAVRRAVGGGPFRRG